MTTSLNDLVALAQSLSGRQPPEAIVETALDSALAVLHEAAGFGLIRTAHGALQVAARHGIGPDGEAVVRKLCEPGSPVLHAVEGGRSQLFSARDPVFLMAGRSIFREEVRFLAVVPFLALGESVGGMGLFLSQEPDRLLWEEGLPYLGATAGLALAQARLKETIALQGRLVSLGRLTAGLADQMQSLLATLGSNLELLRYTLEPSMTSQGRVVRAQDASKMVARLIEGLSVYSEPAGPATKRVLLSDLFSILLTLLSHEARSREVEITVETSAPDLAVRGDRGQLLEVLVHLVENALDAIGHKGRITLEADLAGSEVRISVHDSGPGISPDLLDRVFDPFFTTKTRSTGLGLVSVREIVDRLGGTIGVASELGGGTEFVVTLASN
ncbi:MAG: sensor histidine kinase [Candidatus Methylomirabilia bacterium]